MGRDRRLGVVPVYAVLALTMIDSTMVAVALPQVRSDLRLGVTSLQWVIAAYIVAFAGLLLAGGTLGDHYGRRRMLVGGVATFGVGSVLAAVSTGLPMLIAARVVQGIGAAGSEPGTLSLLRHAYAEERARARVLGRWAAVSGLALAAGPVIGGLFLVAGWRAVFWAEAVLAAGCLLGSRGRIPDSSDPGEHRPDLAGLVLSGVAVAALAGGLIQGQETGFGSAPVVGLFTTSAVAAVLLALVERRVPMPALDLRTLADRKVTAGLLAAAATMFALFSVLLFVSLDLQVVRSLTAVQTAAVFAPMAVGMVAGGPLAGRWVAASGVLVPMTTGLVVAAAGVLATDAALGRHTSVVAVGAALTVLGLGLGATVVPMTAVVLGRVPPARSGMAASAVTAAREVGGVLGVAALGAVVTGLLGHQLTERLAALHIPTFLRSIVIDALERGSPPSGGQVGVPHGIVERVVDAGKDAYVASQRPALIIAAGVLAAGAVAVAVLLRGSAPDTPGRDSATRRALSAARVRTR